MMPSPPDTMTAQFVHRQAREALQQSRQLLLCVQQIQCQVHKTWEVSSQLRQRASEERLRSRQLCQELSSARQRLNALLDRQLLLSTSTRPATFVKRLAPEKLDDLALVRYCKMGERSAWNEFVCRFEPMIFSFARSLCGNEADAADITSEVYVRLYSSLYTFRRGATTFKSWLFRIVRNTYVDVCIRDRNQGLLSLDAPISPQEPGDRHEVIDPKPTPEILCLDNDQLERLAEGIRTLPAYQRQVLTLFLKGRSYEQIAEATGLSMGTVKSRLNRARKTLQERLQDDERLPDLSVARDRRVVQPA